MSSTHSSFSAAAAAREELLKAIEQTRAGLEILMALGVRAMDGQTEALLEVGPALGDTLAQLARLHAGLGSLAQTADGRLRHLLTQRAAKREAANFEQLDALARDASEADHPLRLGRSVVCTTLALLSSLGDDERWCRTLEAPAAKTLTSAMA